MLSGLRKSAFLIFPVTAWTKLSFCHIGEKEIQSEYSISIVYCFNIMRSIDFHINYSVYICYFAILHNVYDVTWSLLLYKLIGPGRFEWSFRSINFNLNWVIDDWTISCGISLRLLLLDPTDDKSTLFQVMTWCHQATNHYLSQCWPSRMSLYSVTRPQ